ncbi:RNA polymerase sigma factor [Pseudomonas sp. SDO524_S393]
MTQEMLARLWAHAWRLSGDVDIAQRLVELACRRVQKGLHPAAGDRSPCAWMFCALHHIWRNELHRLQRCQHTPRVLRMTGVACTHTRLLQAVARLPAEQREAFLLSHVEGFSASDVAYIMGTKPLEVIRQCAQAHRSVARPLARLEPVFNTAPHP